MQASAGEFVSFPFKRKTTVSPEPAREASLASTPKNMQTYCINNVSGFTYSCVSVRFCARCAGGVPAVRLRCGFGHISAVRFSMTALMKTKELQSKKSFPFWPRSGFRKLPEADKHVMLGAILCSSTRRRVQEKCRFHKGICGFTIFDVFFAPPPPAAFCIPLFLTWAIQRHLGGHLVLEHTLSRSAE